MSTAPFLCLVQREPAAACSASLSMGVRFAAVRPWAALEEAYKGAIMVGKFPACVLHMQLAFSAVDVNVHPSKLEVRFADERPIFNAVFHAVKSALLAGDRPKEMQLKPQPNPFEDHSVYRRDRLWSRLFSRFRKKQHRCRLPTGSLRFWMKNLP